MIKNVLNVNWYYKYSQKLVLFQNFYEPVKNSCGNKKRKQKTQSENPKGMTLPDFNYLNFNRYVIYIFQNNSSKKVVFLVS